MSDIDAVIAARQFKESVPQHEADTKRKRDTPRSAINAYKRKQAAIDKDAENDKENAYHARLYRLGMPGGLSMSDIGADRTRSETYEYHPYDELYEPVPYWSDETEWGPGLLKKRAQNAANIATGKGASDVIYGHNKVQRPPAMTADDFINGPQDTFKESRTDIDSRMSAWHDASQHPERTGEFLKAYYKPTPEETAQVRTGGRISMDPDGMRLYNSDGVMTYGPEITAQREAEDAAIRRRGRTPITSSSPNLTDKMRRYLKRKEEAESKRPFTGKLPAQQQQQSQQPAGKEPFTGKMPAQQPAGEKPFTGKMPYTGKEPFAESEDFAKSPTYSYDSYTAANAPIDKLIGASMNAQRQIYDRGKDPQKAMMSEVPVELRGNTGPGKLGFSKEPFGAVAIDIRKDPGQPLSPENTKKYQVTMSGAKASQDRFNKKKAEEQQAAEEQTSDGVDPLFGEIAPRSAAAKEQPAENESPVDERYAALLAKYQ